MECWLQPPPPSKCPSFLLPGLSQLEWLSFAGTNLSSFGLKGTGWLSQARRWQPRQGRVEEYCPHTATSLGDVCLQPNVATCQRCWESLICIHSGPALSSLQLWGLKLNIMFSINNLNWQQAHWMWSFAYKLKPAVEHLRLSWNRFTVGDGLQFCATSHELVSNCSTRALPFFRAIPFQVRVAVPQPTLSPCSPSCRVFGWSSNRNHLTAPAARNSEECVLSLVASRVCPCSYFPIINILCLLAVEA